MWLIPRMWKALTAVVVLLVAGLVWAGSLLVWPQRNYEVQGVCTPVQIDKTYVALTRLKAFRGAADIRVANEFWRSRSHKLSLRKHLEWNVNIGIDELFQRRETAAFLCNSAHTYFRGEPHNIPETAEFVGPYLKTGDDPWKLATCAAMRSPYSPYVLSAESMDHLRNTCAASSTR